MKGNRKGLALLLVMAFVLVGPGCSISIGETSFDPAAEGLVMVKTRPDPYAVEESPESETRSYAIASRGRLMRVAFTPSPETAFYTFPDGRFDWFGDKSDDPDQTKDYRVLDADGNEVSLPSDVLQPMIREIGKIQHAMLLVQIIRSGDEFFVYLELNVNWWSPCRLYYYRQSDEKLVELYTFDNERIVDLAVLSPERLHEQ